MWLWAWSRGAAGLFIYVIDAWECMSWYCFYMLMPYLVLCHFDFQDLI